MDVVRDYDYIFSDVYPDSDIIYEMTFVLSDYGDNKEQNILDAAIYEELSVDAACQTMDMR